MKKIISLTLICILLLSVLAFTSCGKEPIEESVRLPKDMVIEFTCTYIMGKDSDGTAANSLTYGRDANENCYVHYGEEYYGNVEVYETVYVNKSNMEYEIFRREAGENEFTSDGVSNLQSFTPGIPTIFTEQFNYAQTCVSNYGYSYEKIDALSITDETIISVLNNANCKYYRCSKDGSNGWIEFAIQPDYNMTLYTGIQLENGSYETRFITTAYQSNHTTNYSTFVQD